MAQANWQIQAKNTGTERVQDKGYRTKRRSWQFQVPVDKADAVRLKAFMKSELHYYNALYYSLAPRAKTFPETFGGITEKHEQVFLGIAETGFKGIGRAAMSKKSELPEILEPLRDFICGRNDANVPNIGSREDIMFEGAATQAILPGEVRRRMAKEFLDFYKTQAKLYLQRVPSHLAEEQAFMTAPETLEPLDDIRKRHVQIPRNIIKVVWDEEKELTRIYTPYITTPFIVDGVNMEALTGWNYIIIHQEAGKIPLLSTPWIMEFRSIQQKYMLKYVDVMNPNSGTAFNTAKAGAGKH